MICKLAYMVFILHRFSTLTILKGESWETSFQTQTSCLRKIHMHCNYISIMMKYIEMLIVHAIMLHI